LPELQAVIRKIVKDEKDYLREYFNKPSNLDHSIDIIGQHIANGMLVFVNPYVASLSKHDHLFAGDGCYSVNGQVDNLDGGTPCLGEDKLPARYDALLRCYKDLNKMAFLKKSIGDMYWTCVKNT
jgi:hypothetical protein